MNPAEYEIMYRVEETHWWYRGLRALIDFALPAHSRSLLDIGCGTGMTAAHLGTRCAVTGVDVSPLALSSCRARNIKSLAAASATALPFHDSTFDAALMIDVLYHRGVTDKAAALRETARVLRNDGTLIINVPAYQWLYAGHDEAVHTDRRFTRPEIRSLLEASGFEVQQLSYWNTLLLPAIVIRRKLLPASRDASDTASQVPALVERAFGAGLALERAIMRIGSLPVGLSIFGVARKTGDA